ncbi:adenylylsulfate kinase [Filimonas lacunae]|uniref:Adenylyl-sulfate kinase n=1 Tax=Filimonas lacunae TaxID=477680 RepID=A0A173M9R1_9BACT|nr:adenylyl-sulfate kinase [Filimonas lacunae]BAV04250.1 adenylylsulfate kinase [Filimonas lacunae]SIT13573.1 adenylylsulfate kinase [Filimonas lacunae]
MIVQLCGLSGAGKTTLAKSVKSKLLLHGVNTEIVDGDVYREVLCKDLGFSKEDRIENIRRLGFVASRLSANGVVVIISAINPYEEARSEMTRLYRNVKTVHIDCAINELIQRDTKGLYKKALLPDGHPEKLNNLTGINDRFDIPENPDLRLNTGMQTQDVCASELFHFISTQLAADTFYFKKQLAQRYS